MNRVTSTAVAASVGIALVVVPAAAASAKSESWSGIHQTVKVQTVTPLRSDQWLHVKPLSDTWTVVTPTGRKLVKVQRGENWTVKVQHVGPNRKL